jgi:hypothetical protein
MTEGYTPTRIPTEPTPDDRIGGHVILGEGDLQSHDRLACPRCCGERLRKRHPERLGTMHITATPIYENGDAPAS